MPTDEPIDLAQVACELYAVVPARFVATRNARATRLRQDGRREAAAAVKKLPKATAAAWAVSAVVREAGGDLDALGELGAELRVAQRLANPAELRSLSRRRRDQVAALTRTAVRIAEEHDVELSPAAQEQVSATWQAAVIDPLAERAVRSGLLLRALEPGQGDLQAPLGVPVDLGEVEPAVADDEPEPAGDDDVAEPPRKAKSRLGTGNGRPAPARKPRADAEDSHVRGGIRIRRPAVADDGSRAAPSSPPARDVAREVRRLRRDLRSRERIAEQMREELDEASDELGRVEAAVLQVAARLEELRREVAEVQEQLAELDGARAAAREEREDAADRARAAAEQLTDVRERLAELEA